MTLFIGFVLGEHAAQIGQAGFGAAIRLFARSSRQFFLAHGHTGAVGADIHNRHSAAAGCSLPLLPLLGCCPDPLHHALDLPGAHVNAPGLGQMLLGLLVAGFIGSLQANQPGQGWGMAGFQAQRGIRRIMALGLACMVVIVALQLEGARLRASTHDDQELVEALERAHRLARSGIDEAGRGCADG